MTVVRMNQGVKVSPEILIAQLQEIEFQDVALVYIEKGETEARVSWSYMMTDRLSFLGLALLSKIQEELKS